MGVNEPALWSVEEASNQVGTAIRRMACGIGEEWVVIAGRSGLYLFDGGYADKAFSRDRTDLGRLSIGRPPPSYPWWVQVDTQHKRILIGVPTGSWRDNRIVTFTPSITPRASLILLPRRRPLSIAANGSPWTIAASSCGLIERPNGPDQIFLGNNSGSGKILGLTPGTFTDDGAAINSYYTTAFLSRLPLSGRNLVGYATANIQGSGTLQISALLPGNVTQPIGTWSLASPATEHMEIFTNILGERIAYQLSTTSATDWFSVTKYTLWAKPDPWAVVRGHN